MLEYSLDDQLNTVVATAPLPGLTVYAVFDKDRQNIEAAAELMFRVIEHPTTLESGGEQLFQDRETFCSLVSEQLEHPNSLGLLVRENEGGEAVGVALIFGSDSGPAVVGGLYVEPDWQRSGVGTFLIETLIAHLEEQRITEVIFDVAPENHDALRLYKRFGVEFKNTEPDGQLRFSATRSYPFELPEGFWDLPEN